MTTEKKFAYLWVTWLSPLLVGADACEWKAWFKSHHYYSKLPSNMDFTAWEMMHTELMTKTADQIMNDYEGKVDIYTEGEGAFNLQGKQSKITLAGKPDLIVVPHGDELPSIWDCKTGNPKSSHKAQLLIYMYAIPLVVDKFKGLEFTGTLRYGSDDYVTVEHNELDTRFKSQLIATIKRVGSQKPALKVPSANECGFCEISKDDCPERNEGQTQRAKTSDF